MFNVVEGKHIFISSQIFYHVVVNAFLFYFLYIAYKFVNLYY